MIQEELPWKGRSVFRFESENPVSGELALRIPQWCVRYSLTMNQHSDGLSVERGYLVVKREWKDGDVLEWVLEMEPSFVRQISGYSMMRAKQLNPGTSGLLSEEADERTVSS